jgi:hypothetical protein
MSFFVLKISCECYNGHMGEYIAPPHETVSFALTVLGQVLVGLGILTNNPRTKRAGGAVLLGVGAAGIALAWDRWSRRAGRHMSVKALRSLFTQPLNDEEKRALQAHFPQLVLGVVALW